MSSTPHSATLPKTARRGQAWLNRLERWLQRLHARENLPEHLATGWRGELAAYFHLRRQGYTIVAQGWRSHITPGDLDLVGWDGNRLCFVEVKARTTQDVATAEAAVDEDKRRTLQRLARRYLKRAEVPEAAARFDVVTVYFEEDQEPEIALIRNAFGWKS
jgi:putative endonuclease